MTTTPPTKAVRKPRPPVEVPKTDAERLAALLIEAAERHGLCDEFYSEVRKINTCLSTPLPIEKYVKGSEIVYVRLWLEVPPGTFSESNDTYRINSKQIEALLRQGVPTNIKINVDESVIEEVDYDTAKAKKVAAAIKKEKKA